MGTALGPDGIRRDTGDLTVGYLLTTSHLDLTDHDALLREELDALLAGHGTFTASDPVPEIGAASPEGRVYAQLTGRVLYDEAGNAAGSTQEYVFPELEGFRCFTCFIDDEAGGYITSAVDDAVSDAHLSIHTDDEGESRTLTATVYVTAKADAAAQAGEAGQIEVSPGVVMSILPPDTRTLYFNPVYQSADGAVYVTAGTGFSWAGSMATGGVYTQSLRGESAVTLNGERSVYSCETAVSVELVDRPLSVTVTGMDAAHRPVFTSEFAPDAAPEALDIAPGTAYLLIETRSLRPDGTQVSERSLSDPDEETLDVLCARDDGLCVKKTVRLHWPS